MHHRKHPKNHRFVYQLFLLGIELNDVQKVTNQLVPLSYNRFNLFSFYDRDHMQPDDRTARKKFSPIVKSMGSIARKTPEYS